jgi:hypothetical protein
LFCGTFTQSDLENSSTARLLCGNRAAMQKNCRSVDVLLTQPDT